MQGWLVWVSLPSGPQSKSQVLNRHLLFYFIGFICKLSAHSWSIQCANFFRSSTLTIPSPSPSSPSSSSMSDVPGLNCTSNPPKDLETCSLLLSFIGMLGSRLPPRADVEWAVAVVIPFRALRSDFGFCWCGRRNNWGSVPTGLGRDDSYNKRGVCGANEGAVYATWMIHYWGHLSWPIRGLWSSTRQEYHLHVIMWKYILLISNFIL